MIWHIVKKQLLIFIRNPQQLLLLIGLPIILIVILSVSLSSFMQGEKIRIEGKVAIMEHSDEQEQIREFLKELDQSNVEKEQKMTIAEAAKQLPFIQLLKEDVFGDMVGTVQLEQVSPSAKASVLKNDEYAAVIEVPHQFTYDTLRSLFLDVEENGNLNVYMNEGNEIAANLVKGVVSSFQEQLTMFTFAEKNEMDGARLKMVAQQSLGERTNLDQRRPISSKEYYTVGMAVMNVLFIATAISSFAFVEKQSQVFNRVILSNVSRWSYLLGIFGSGTVFSLVQLLIIFSFSWFVFDVTWPHFLPFSIVTICMALTIGGISVLLTAISYRNQSESVINFFGNILVYFFALLGGSYFPIGDFSNTVQLLGDFTPNGAGMTAYLHLLRGSGFDGISEHIGYLLIVTVSCLLIAVMSFPKRGQVS